MKNRIKAACKTNSAQVDSVVVLTLMNIVAVISGPELPPILVIVSAILPWPALAFFANLIHPIE
jgi:hypothetical protein